MQFFLSEGQLPKGALYIEEEQTFRRPQNDPKPSRVGPGEICKYLPIISNSW